MALYILTDPIYSSGLASSAGRTVTSIKKLSRKKIQIKELEDVKNLPLLFDEPNSFLFIPADFKDSHADIIRACNRHSVPVITAHNHPQMFPRCFYSAVVGDNDTQIDMLISYCLHYNKKRIAFLGISTFSNADKIKVTTLYSMYPEFHYKDVFFNNGNLSDSFEDFFARRYEYDAILCANDFVGIAFIEEMKKRDPDYLQDRFIIGFMNTLISQLYSPSLTSLTYDGNDITRAVLATYRFFQKNRENFVSVSTMLHDIIEVRESTHYFPYNKEYSNPYNNSNYFTHRVFNFPEKQMPIVDYYSDPFVMNLVKLEDMLISLDLIDFEIILLFLMNVKNPEVCEQLYISAKTIQYRSKSIFRKLGVGNKKEFIKYATRYIQANNLKEYIEMLKNE